MATGQYKRDWKVRLGQEKWARGQLCCEMTYFMSSMLSVAGAVLPLVMGHDVYSCDADVSPLADGQLQLRSDISKSVRGRHVCQDCQPEYQRSQTRLQYSRYEWSTSCST